MEQWKRYCGGTVARLMTFFSRDKHRNHFSCLESKYWISSHNQILDIVLIFQIHAAALLVLLAYVVFWLSAMAPWTLGKIWLEEY